MSDGRSESHAAGLVRELREAMMPFQVTGYRDHALLLSRAAAALEQAHDELAGDTNAKAAAWVAVFRLCRDLGMAESGGCGRDKVLGFIRGLAVERGTPTPPGEARHASE